MKWLYKEFNKYLPRVNYNRNPVLYLTNGRWILYVYSFDRKKEVVLTSDEWTGKFRYMSLFEILHDEWRIIHKNDLDKIINVYSDPSELPF